MLQDVVRWHPVDKHTFERWEGTGRAHMDRFVGVLEGTSIQMGCRNGHKLPALTLDRLDRQAVTHRGVLFWPAS